jgi:hypothetical protein
LTALGQLQTDNAAGAVDPIPRQAESFAPAHPGEQRELDQVGQRLVFALPAGCE